MNRCRLNASRLLYLSLVLFLAALLWLNRDLLGEVFALSDSF